MDKEKEKRLEELEHGYAKYGPQLFVRYYGNKAFIELKCLRIARQMEKKT